MSMCGRYDFGLDRVEIAPASTSLPARRQCAHGGKRRGAAGLVRAGPRSASNSRRSRGALLPCRSPTPRRALFSLTLKTTAA